MQAVIRQYSGTGAVELFDLLEKHKGDVDALMGSVTGLVSYTLARSSGGGFTVTVCQDKAGIDESTQKAKEWIIENGKGIGAAPPMVSVGEVVVHLTK